jgi:hypothetical protein
MEHPDLPGSFKRLLVALPLVEKHPATITCSWRSSTQC